MLQSKQKACPNDFHTVMTPVLYSLNMIKVYLTDLEIETWEKTCQRETCQTCLVLGLDTIVLFESFVIREKLRNLQNGVKDLLTCCKK